MTRILTKPLIIALFISVLSCDRESLIPEEAATNRIIPSTPVDRIREGFTLNNFSDPTGTVKDNLQIQWENHSTRTISETLWYEFGVIQQQKAHMVSQFQEDNQYRLLARLDENDEPHYFLAKLAPEPFISAQDFSYFNPESFSGTVSLYNLQGQVIFLEYYKKGQVQNSVKDISIKEDLKAPLNNQCIQKGTAMAKCDTALDCAFVFADGNRWRMRKRRQCRGQLCCCTHGLLHRLV